VFSTSPITPDAFNFPLNVSVPANSFGVTPGQSASFHCAASGSPTFTFIQYKAGYSRTTPGAVVQQSFPSTSTCLLRIDAVAESMQLNYAISAKNAGGESFIDFSILVFDPPTVSAVAIGPSSTVDPGTTVVMTISANSDLGTGPLTYVWQYSSTPLGPFRSVATTSLYRLPKVTEFAEGFYFVTVTLNPPVSSPLLSTNSPVATLIVNGMLRTRCPLSLSRSFVQLSDFFLADPPTIQSKSSVDSATSISLGKDSPTFNLNFGTTVTITVVVTGATPMTFTWRKNSVIISSVTTAKLTLAVDLSVQANYSVSVSNSVATDVASFTVLVRGRFSVRAMFVVFLDRLLPPMLTSGRTPVP